MWRRIACHPVREGLIGGPSNSFDAFEYSSRDELGTRLMADNIQPLIAKSLVLTALAAALLLAGCSRNSAPNAQAGGPPAMPVKVLEAKAVPVDDATEYVATLKSRDSAVIMPQVEGLITQIFVHSGERVEAGAPLIEIDPLKQQATVKSLESARTAQAATLSWAKKQYERAQGLVGGGCGEQAGSGPGQGDDGRGTGTDGFTGFAGARTGSAVALLQSSRAKERHCRRHSSARGGSRNDGNAVDHDR